MAKKKRQSALVLTKSAWDILQKYRNAYGVKKTLSVALELFDKLESEDRFARVNAAGVADKIARQTEAAVLKQHKKPRRTASKEAG